MLCRLLAFSAHVLAALPMKRAEEPLTLVQLINTIVLRRCETIAASLQEWLAAQVQHQALSL